MCGIDINPPIKGYRCYQADQKDRIQIYRALDYFNISFFDIIIDDGSHMQQDQQISFATLFPVVKSGGYYVIEDVANQVRLIQGDKWGQNKDASDCTDLMFSNYCKGERLVSHFLSERECRGLENKIADAFVYDESKRNNSPVSGTSKLIIIKKK